MTIPPSPFPVISHDEETTTLPLFPSRSRATDTDDEQAASLGNPKNGDRLGGRCCRVAAGSDEMARRQRNEFVDILSATTAAAVFFESKGLD